LIYITEYKYVLLWRLEMSNRSTTAPFFRTRPPLGRTVGKLAVLFLLLSLASIKRIPVATKSTRYEKVLPSKNSIQKVVEREGFFDCDRDDSLCTFFRPQHFFREKGKPFLVDYERLGGTNKNLPACTSLSWWSHDDDERELFFSLPHNISFVHMHKCGGTTVQQTMLDVRKNIRASGSSYCHIQTYKYSIGGGSAQTKEQNRLKRDAHIQAIAQAQEKGAEFPVFTLVRDPVERFLSAFQEVMHYNEDLRSSCLKRTAKATINCVIEDIRRTSYRRDVHLVPMAMHLRLFDDIAVSVFHLEDIALISQYFVGSSRKVKHSRDRTQEKYATSKILAQMSVADCDRQMIRDICDLYAIDVAMMESIGFATPNCRYF
jgi:hypothetical protein